MKLTGLKLHRIALPLVAPFTTSFSTQTVKDTFLLEAAFEGENGPVTGWGESVAMTDPLYSPEYVDGSIDVITKWLAPLLRDAEDLTAETVAWHLRHIIGHPMSKAAMEMAVLEAQLKDRNLSFRDYLGGVETSVPSGVSVGIQDSIPDLLKVIGGYLEEGYARIKLKIKPGKDIEPVAAVRKEFGDDFLFQVDANAAYTLVDSARLRRLDEYGLLLIEQPLGEADIRQHAELAKRMSTPMCLDESIVSAEAAADAIALGACDIINIKPGRVGGYLEARKIHDLAKAAGIAVWHGGMLETGLGRAANAALATLPGFTLPGDISGSNRFYAEDITEEIVMHDGRVDVPTGPGFGVTVDPAKLEKYTVNTITVF
ncbi:o-succinylbenzoate synthase [Brevibacterium sp. 50QC2O2]|jgi:O-succinylbenzoate synthase|uniref:o-succinylbenzoate synthase n=1 Tax=Brevibacterium TaxID=1696 RepID=UPI00211C8055|nr:MULTISPECIES: o-succinylbenzoate synthase [unclassified Brevibacterium]MCQ9369301.1 o-succinylbenzoate synthase [Brevibacterium sp. 91QC2O2]MCQ9386683.1 o-succinylbenzoate synthase [Brevibacterium sp. 68QC2CO]MCQ9388696.1 o-succinylbenzoate synthase [Brevibacterium sp. 50QC2O2]